MQSVMVVTATKIQVRTYIERPYCALMDDFPEVRKSIAIIDTL
jgi:hypothetical protein